MQYHSEILDIQDQGQLVFKCLNADQECDLSVCFISNFGSFFWLLVKIPIYNLWTKNGHNNFLIPSKLWTQKSSNMMLTTIFRAKKMEFHLLIIQKIVEVSQHNTNALGIPKQQFLHPNDTKCLEGKIVGDYFKKSIFFLQHNAYHNFGKMSNWNYKNLIYSSDLVSSYLNTSSKPQGSLKWKIFCPLRMALDINEFLPVQ